MTLILTSGPDEEPVTLDEARAFLRLDATDEDALVAAFITAARTVLEAETRRAFVTQGWRLLLDRWPARGVSIPLAPVSAVTRLALVAADGAMQELDASLYETALAGDAPRIVAAGAWPAPPRRVGGIAVDFVAGYGAAADVPQPLKQALLMLVAHWFETRTPVAFGDAPADIPLTVAALVAPYRRPHL
jgi:uncharacterized phiE125 gp8 family phage protein